MAACLSEQHLIDKAEATCLPQLLEDVLVACWSRDVLGTEIAQ